MKTVRIVGAALAISLPCGIAAANNDAGSANNDDGFVWIDANTRIKIKPVSTVKPVPTTAGTGASAPEKSPKKIERKEKPAK
ncbi:MAG TPA: hypothetical protein VEX61_04040 [Burkholderiales bacterium]|nr:hypothetical protein [Burkholderiales bacterium]